MKLWNRFKTAETSANLTALQKELVEERAALDRQLEEFAAKKMAVLREKGPEALQTHISLMRTIEDQIELMDVAITDIVDRLEAAKSREAAAELEASAKRAHVEMTRRTAIREEFMTLVMKARELQEEDQRLSASIRLVYGTLGKADRRDLKPVDTLAKRFTDAKIPYSHPI